MIAPQRAADPAWLAEPLHHWRQRAGWVLEQQITIARTPAPTAQEQARAQLFRRALHARGLVTRTDAVGNVTARIAPIARSSTAESPLVCMAHLDTVFGSAQPLEVRREGAIVHCPGISDNGRGLAAMIVLAETLAGSVQAQLTRPVDLVLTVSEEGEGNLRGARHWFTEAAAREALPIAAIAIDGPGDRVIVNRATGSLRLRITLAGRGGHSGSARAVPNAVNAAGQLIAALSAHAARVRTHTLITITRMCGGEQLTGVPMRAWIDVDMRASTRQRLADARVVVETLAHARAADESRHDPSHPLHVTVIVLGERPSGALCAAHPLVAQAMHATRAVDRDPELAAASTDANVPLSLGIPAITIGAGGSGGGMHTPQEWYDDTHGAIGVERVLRLVLAIGTSVENLEGWRTG